MAKTKKEGDKFVLHAVLAILVIAVLVGLTLMTGQRDDELTAWASIEAKNLHFFMKDCRSAGGTIDVRPNFAPVIKFVCDYAASDPPKTVEYDLDPGGIGRKK